MTQTLSYLSLWNHIGKVFSVLEWVRCWDVLLVFTQLSDKWTTCSVMVCQKAVTVALHLTSPVNNKSWQWPNVTFTSMYNFDLKIFLPFSRFLSHLSYFRTMFGAFQVILLIQWGFTSLPRKWSNCFTGVLLQAISVASISSLLPLCNTVSMSVLFWA